LGDELFHADERNDGHKNRAYSIFYTFSSCDIAKFLQNLGDYTDMSQGVAAYAVYATDVLLICWCGTQLTQHVRQSGLSLLLLTLLKP